MNLKLKGPPNGPKISYSGHHQIAPVYGPYGVCHPSMFSFVSNYYHKHIGPHVTKKTLWHLQFAFRSLAETHSQLHVGNLEFVTCKYQDVALFMVHI